MSLHSDRRALSPINPLTGLFSFGRVPLASFLLFLALAAPVSAQDTVPPVPAAADIKPGSIDDVNAIGTRNIGGRGLGKLKTRCAECLDPGI